MSNKEIISVIRKWEKENQALEYPWAFVLLEKSFRYNSGKTKNSSPNRHSYYYIWNRKENRKNDIKVNIWKIK